jgi:hypothetical protein
MMVGDFLVFALTATVLIVVAKTAGPTAAGLILLGLVAVGIVIGLRRSL